MKEHFLTDHFLKYLFKLCSNKSVNSSNIRLIEYIMIHGRLPKDPARIEMLIKTRRNTFTRTINNLIKEQIFFEDDDGYIMPHIKTYVHGKLINPIQLKNQAIIDSVEDPDKMESKISTFMESLDAYRNKKELLDSVIEDTVIKLLELYRKALKRPTYFLTPGKKEMMKFAINREGRQKCEQAILGLATDKIARYRQSDDLIADCLYDKALVAYRIEQFKLYQQKKRKVTNVNNI